MKTLFSILILSILFSPAMAATYTSSGSGAWTTTTNWTPTAPAGGPTWNDVVIIQTPITLASGSYSGSGSVTIQSGGSLTVTGNLTITASGTKLIVGTGGSLSVSGTFSVSSQSKLTMSGGTVTAHTMSVAAGTYEGNSGTVNVTNGDLTTTNSGNTNFTNNLGTTINISLGNLVSNTTFANSGAINVNTGGVSHANSGGNFTNSGQMYVKGDFAANGIVKLNPGATANSKLAVLGNMTIPGNALTIGTNVAPGYYADLVVYQTLESTGGNVTVEKNGRVGIFGDLKLTGGGISFNITSGGQVYVDGDGTGADVIINGGGTVVNNNNPNATPAYGFYVNNTVSVTGGGSAVDADRADEVVMKNSNPTFYNWVASQPNGPLPVVLLYFKVAAVDANGITLRWVTTMEKNFDRFEIERAGKDLSFTTVGTLAGKGGLNLNTPYEFIDPSPLQGKNYYRLKNIDLDGTYEYSAVIVGAWVGVSSGVSIYPNPVVDRSFTLELNDILTTPAQVSVLDAKGYVINTSEANSTSSTITLPANLNPGIYFVKIASTAGQETIRIVVTQ